MNTAGHVGVAQEKINAASGLMNFMRNIGQSNGNSTVTPLIARRSQFHQTILAEHTASGRFQAAIEGLASQLNHVGLRLQAAHEHAIWQTLWDGSNAGCGSFISRGVLASGSERSSDVLRFVSAREERTGQVRTHCRPLRMGSNNDLLS
jgi:hypothetical protein